MAESPPVSDELAFAGYVADVTTDELRFLASHYKLAIKGNLLEIVDHGRECNRIEQVRSETRLRENQWRLRVTAAELDRR